MVEYVMNGPQHRLGHGHLEQLNHDCCKTAHLPCHPFLYCYNGSWDNNFQAAHNIGCDHSDRVRLPCHCPDLHDHWHNPYGHPHHHHAHLFGSDRAFWDCIVVPLTVNLPRYALALPVMEYVHVDLRQPQQHFLSLLHPAKQKPHMIQEKELKPFFFFISKRNWNYWRERSAMGLI